MSCVPQRYKKLGDLLLSAVGTEKTQAWVAKKAYCSQEAVHFWMTGYSRPRPERLGRLAAIFDLDPVELASLAEYDDNPNAFDKVQAAYRDNLIHLKA